MRHFALALAFLFAVGAQAQQKSERRLFVAANSHEVEATFDAKVEIPSSTQPTEQLARQQIDKQIAHMFGPLGHGFNSANASPKTDHTITNVKISQGANGIWVASYTYTGTIAVGDGATKLEIPLPNNPSTIYRSSMSDGYNPCMDGHGNESSFWYYWNPASYGCKLVKGKDYQVVTATMKHKENSKSTYPDYARLVDANGEIKITVLMGMLNETHDYDPNVAPDMNAGNYRSIKKQLLGSGYTALGAASAAELQKLAPGTNGKGIYVETLSKQVDGPRGKIKITVRMFWGPTGVYETSQGFHHVLADSFKNDSVMLYGGHSGLGSNLNFEKIKRASNVDIVLPADKYQIFYFNSCSSYPYYNSVYFGRKGGTKNLDIITNGLLTYANVIDDTMNHVLRAIDLWATGGPKVSYQALAKSLDSDNLLGINGDEDNPTE